MSRCDSCRYQNDFEFHACHICHMERDMYKPKRTNADRIRAMTDEELAVWLAKNDPECDPPEWWLDWLKQKVEDGK